MLIILMAIVKTCIWLIEIKENEDYLFELRKELDREIEVLNNNLRTLNEMKERRNSYFD